jgi:hypothetical protein
LIHFRADQPPDTLTEGLDSLGETYLAAGDSGAAREVWRKALSILDELDHPDASQLRIKIGGLDE